MAKSKNPNGMGSYRKKGTGYEWKQMVDGQMRYLSARSLKELQEKVRHIADLPIIKEKYKVFEWFERWLGTYIQPLKSAATYEQYKNITKKHILPQIGNRKLTSIKPVDIQGVIAAMNKNNLSSWTMKHARKVMAGAFAKAVKEKIIAENPMVDIEIPVKQQKVRKVLQPDELSKIFDAMKKSRWIWSVRFMLVTGLRRGELLALRWSDIDFANKQITVSRSNSDHGMKDTKSGKVHYVPLSAMAVQYLDKQKEMLDAETNPILWIDELKKTELIFPAQDGKLMPAHSYYTMLARYARSVGIAASPHCLRHTFVYMMRDKLSLKDLQNVLGHDESTTTLDIYGDILSNNIEKTAGQIDEVFEKVDMELKKERKKGKVIQFPNAK